MIDFNGPQLPDNFDYIALGELLDVIEELVDYSRAGTCEEQGGEDAAWKRARGVLARYKPAVGEHE